MRIDKVLTMEFTPKIFETSLEDFLKVGTNWEIACVAIFVTAGGGEKSVCLSQLVISWSEVMDKRQTACYVMNPIFFKANTFPFLFHQTFTFLLAPEITKSDFAKVQEREEEKSADITRAETLKNIERMSLKSQMFASTSSQDVKTA